MQDTDRRPCVIFGTLGVMQWSLVVVMVGLVVPATQVKAQAGAPSPANDEIQSEGPPATSADAFWLLACRRGHSHFRKKVLAAPPEIAHHARASLTDPSMIRCRAPAISILGLRGRAADFELLRTLLHHGATGPAGPYELGAFAAIPGAMAHMANRPLGDKVRTAARDYLTRCASSEHWTGRDFSWVAGESVRLKLTRACIKALGAVAHPTAKSRLSNIAGDKTLPWSLRDAATRAQRPRGTRSSLDDLLTP